MEKTTRRLRAGFAALFFLALAGCDQKEPARPPEPQADAVENWISKRSERRTVSTTTPRAAPLIPAETKTLPASIPAVRTDALPAVPLVRDSVAAPVLPRVERKKAFSQQTYVKAPPLRYDAKDFLSEVELGAVAWTQGDFAGAFDWFHRAAEGGNSEAQLNVGMMYAYGEGVEQDYDAALRWFEKALAQKNLNRDNLEILKEVVTDINRLALLEMETPQLEAAPVFNRPTVLIEAQKPFVWSAGVTKENSARRYYSSGIIMQALSRD